MLDIENCGRICFFPLHTEKHICSQKEKKRHILRNWSQCSGDKRKLNHQFVTAFTRWFSTTALENRPNQIILRRIVIYYGDRKGPPPRRHYHRHYRRDPKCCSIINWPCGGGAGRGSGTACKLVVRESVVGGLHGKRKNWSHRYDVMKYWLWKKNTVCILPILSTRGYICSGGGRFSTPLILSREKENSVYPRSRLLAPQAPSWL